MHRVVRVSRVPVIIDCGVLGYPLHCCRHMRGGTCLPALPSSAWGTCQPAASSLSVKARRRRHRLHGAGTGFLSPSPFLWWA